MAKRKYDPNWPFPQYDKDGKRLMPPKPPKQKKPAYPTEEDALL